MKIYKPQFSLYKHKLRQLLNLVKQSLPINLAIGKRGEEIAKKYLEKKGYKIIEQNYKTRYAEIDLVAERKNELVFIEVRTRVGDDFGIPEETINEKKLKKLMGNAAAYAAKIKWRNIYRIDAVCIVLEEDYSLKRLNHYENIV